MIGDSDSTWLRRAHQRRPALLIALAIIVGILIPTDRSILANVGVLGSAILAVSMVLALVLIIRLRQRVLIGTLLLALLSWGNHVWHAGLWFSHDLRLILGTEARIARIVGIVQRPPQLSARESADGPEFESRFVLQVREIEIDQNPQTASGKIHVRVRQALPDNLFQGAEVSLTGCVARPDRPRLPGAFDYRHYLNLRGIYYETLLADWSRVSITAKGAPPLPSRFQSWAREALAIGQPEDQATRLIWAMVLGWRAWLNGEMRDPFLSTGTMHLFAISGMHVAVVAGLMMGMAKALRIPRRYAILLVIPLLWIYTIATGSPASAVRASTITSIVLLGTFLQRPPDALNSLGAAAAILLFAEPRQLFQPGFQLSFTVVTSLAVLYPKFQNWSRSFFPGTRLTPVSDVPRWQKLMMKICLKLYSALGISLAAWLGSLPLIAYYFKLVTPIGLLANLLLIPMAGMTLASSMMALSVASWWTSLASIANSSAWFWMTAMQQLCRWLAPIPGSHFAVPCPALEWIVAYYAGILLWVAVPPSCVRRWVAVVAIGVVIMISSFRFYQRSGEAFVIFLPIPQGDAIFVDRPGQARDIMIDGGPAWCADQYLHAFLEDQRGTTRYRNHLLSHGDKQHVEALNGLATHESVRRFFVSSLSYRSRYYRDLVEQLEEQGHSIHRIDSSDQILDWEVRYPHQDTRPSPADYAPVVLYSEIHGIRLLLISDLHRGAQKELLNRSPNFEVDILSLSLPADSNEPNLFVLRQLNPRCIIVTGSANGMGQRWVEALRQGLSDRTTPIFFTGLDGTITVHLEHEKVSVLGSRSGRQLVINLDSRSKDSTKLESPK